MNNEPAFPAKININGGFGIETAYTPGMQLRDWFAGQALISLDWGSVMVAHLYQEAEACYRMADAMLAAREKDANR